ncbi:MAG: hypothetical protein WKG32_20985 [Gemmatimonadaceae bacterium]
MGRRYSVKTIGELGELAEDFRGFPWMQIPPGWVPPGTAPIPGLPSPPVPAAPASPTAVHASDLVLPLGAAALALGLLYALSRCPP